MDTLISYNILRHHSNKALSPHSYYREGAAYVVVFDVLFVVDGCI